MNLLAFLNLIKKESESGDKLDSLSFLFMRCFYFTNIRSVTTGWWSEG